VPLDGGAEAAPEVTEPAEAAETAETTEPAEVAKTAKTPEPEAGTGAEPAASVEPTAEAAKPAPGQAAAIPTQKPRPAPKPTYDEYDRLEEAAGSDALAEDRPRSRDYEWYLRQGHAELAARSYARARASFESALEVRPGSAEAMDGLGHASIGLEDFDSALRYFRVAAHRGHPDGYFHLGRIYQRLGRNEEAVSAYYTYLKRYPSGSHVAAARSAIKALEPRTKLPFEREPNAAQESEQKSEPVAP
jgi:tetratricopeptide (TPR) repeat protein